MASHPWILNDKWTSWVVVVIEGCADRCLAHKSIHNVGIDCQVVRGAMGHAATSSCRIRPSVYLYTATKM